MDLQLAQIRNVEEVEVSLGRGSFGDCSGSLGLVDVLDCYLIIGMFCFVWVGQFMMVKEGKDVEEAIKIVKRLKDEDKVKVMDYLKMVLGDG